VPTWFGWCAGGRHFRQVRARAVYRSVLVPGFQDADIGFRVVCVSPIPLTHCWLRTLITAFLVRCPLPGAKRPSVLFWAYGSEFVEWRVRATGRARRRTTEDAVMTAQLNARGAMDRERPTQPTSERSTREISRLLTPRPGARCRSIIAAADGKCHPVPNSASHAANTVDVGGSVAVDVGRRRRTAGMAARGLRRRRSALSRLLTRLGAEDVMRPAHLVAFRSLSIRERCRYLGEQCGVRLATQRLCHL